MSTSTDFLRILEHHRIEYLKTLPAKVAAIGRLWDDVRLSVAEPEALETLIRMTHGLAGSGAIFGFDDLGVEARRLETRLETLRDGGIAAILAEEGLVAAGIAALRRCLARTTGHP